MAFNLQDVAVQNNIGQNLFGPSWTLTQDIQRSEIYRQDAKKDALVRDVVMKGLPVITEAQLRKGHELHPISMIHARDSDAVDSDSAAGKLRKKRKDDHEHDDEHEHDEHEHDEHEHDSVKPVALSRKRDVKFGPANKPANKK